VRSQRNATFTAIDLEKYSRNEQNAKTKALHLPSLLCLPCLIFKGSSYLIWLIGGNSCYNFTPQPQPPRNKDNRKYYDKGNAFHSTQRRPMTSAVMQLVQFAG
jgi:hypothetical protein